MTNSIDLIISVLEVKSIKSLEGLWDGMVRSTRIPHCRIEMNNLLMKKKTIHSQEWYTIVKKGEEEDEATDQLYSIDELYVAVNGRRSLIRYHGKFL